MRLAAENCCPLQEDVRKLERALEQATGDIDILLTCEWPADVTAATPPGSAPAEVSTPGQPSLTLPHQPPSHCPQQQFSPMQDPAFVFQVSDMTPVLCVRSQATEF